MKSKSDLEAIAREIVIFGGQGKQTLIAKDEHKKSRWVTAFVQDNLDRDGIRANECELCQGTCIIVDQTQHFSLLKLKPCPVCDPDGGL